MNVSTISRHMQVVLRTPAARFAVTGRRFQSSGGAAMKFTFASPTKAYFTQADVRQVDVPTFSGAFGILPNHVPMLAVLKPGLVTVYENDGKTQKIFVSSGSVTINDDSSVQILAEEATALENLDKQAAQQGLSEAQQQLSSAGDDARRAEAQIAIETYEAIIAS